MNDSIRKSSRKKQKPREYWRNDVFSENGPEDSSPSRKGGSPPRKDARGAEVAPCVTTPHQRRNEERETEILPGESAEDTSTKPHRLLFAIGYRHGAKVARARAAKKSFAANRALVEGVPATPLEGVPESLLEDIPLNETLIDEVATIETPHQPHIEKAKWGGWRPGLGRPRKFLESGTPIRRRYKPGEPRPPRGRPSQRDPKDITPVVKRIRYKAGEPRPKRGRPKKTQQKQLAVLQIGEKVPI